VDRNAHQCGDDGAASIKVKGLPRFGNVVGVNDAGEY